MKKLLVCLLHFLLCFTPLFVIQSEILKADDDEKEYFRSPKEIQELMQNGRIFYIPTVFNEDEIDKLVLNKDKFQLVTYSPFYCMKHDLENKTSALIDYTPKGEIENLYKITQELVMKNEYDKAIENYNKMIALDSNWFKAWGNLGDCYYFKKEYKKAEEYLLKAIELNEIGYQEHLYLSDTYYAMGDFEKSLEYIIKAFMLNRNSLAVKKSLDRILAHFNLKYNDSRLSLNVNIEIINQDSVKICYIVSKRDMETTFNLIAFIQCYAFWVMNPGNKFYEEGDDVNKLIYMYKECLVNQFLIMQNSIKEKDKKLNKAGVFIYNAINDGYLEEMVLWDIMGVKIPTLSLMMPKESKVKICEYIIKYCFEPIEK